jgi:integrase
MFNNVFGYPRTPKSSCLLFYAKRGGPIRESRFVQCQFKPLLKSAELPAIRLYDLRHTAATLSLAAGSPQKSSASNSATPALPLNSTSIRTCYRTSKTPPRKKFKRC